ncbi:hypothetical protein [uncultured Sphingomonas sp.]|uniref:hypothetical protein n=1 Tax=uncultured Sphingomonas sp. TaxID=158754 RepID=UPI0035CA761B
MPSFAHILLAVAAATGLVSAAAAQDLPPPPATQAIPAQTPPAPAPAVALPTDPGDAAAYATAFGVSVAAARQRLDTLAALVAPIAALRVAYRDRLAGIALDHSPALGVRVLLTGPTPVSDSVIVAAGSSVPVTFATGAGATLEQLRAALANSQADLRAALTSPPGIGIDQRTGELVIIVGKGDLIPEGGELLTARLRDIAGVPLRIRSIDVPGVDLAAEGGSRLIGTNPLDGKRYVCTAGFVVTDGTRTAIATAAHCPDTIAYIDADRREWPLAFVGQWGWGYQDVQINASDIPLSPLFFADTARSVSRSVTGQRGVVQTTTGDFVCHRGERTGYSCALVELTDFAPAGDLCGGACTPSWITVAGPHCGAGDSGAPVFIDTTGFGIVKGGSYRSDGRCAFYFYMSVDYLPAGWRLLTVSPPAMLAPPAAVE